jgi:signal transduction histidine kinase
VTRLRSTWRRLGALDPRLVDGLLAVALATGSTLEFVREAPNDLARLPLVPIPALALVLRRRYPLLCFPIQVAATSLVQRPPTVIGFAALVIGIYSVGAYSRWRLPSLALLVAAAVGLEVAVPQARPPLPDWSLNPLLIVGLWLAGDAVRSLQQRARQLEREQELAARVAVADERSRIARELHDVVAHSVSLMVIQAGAARRLVGRQPDRAADTLQTVEDGGREALRELRRMLGLLTARDGDEPGGDQPRLDQVPALAERMRAAGLPVDLRIEGPRRELSPDQRAEARTGRAHGRPGPVLGRRAAAGGRGRRRPGGGRRDGRGPRPGGDAGAGRRLRRGAGGGPAPGGRLRGCVPACRFDD